MQKNLLLSFVFFIVTLYTTWAQQTAIYTHDLIDFNKALSLYNDKQYQSAQILFDKVKQQNSNLEIQADCTFYSANCAIRLNQNNADEAIENFVKEYPTSTKQNLAYIEAATYYFEQGKYVQAVEWFEKVDENTLANDEMERFNFYRAYSFFNSGMKKEASTYFNKVVNSKEYGNQAKYYLGFLAYQSDNYDEANKYFDEVSDEQKYKEKLSYFQADMAFKQGNFDKAITLAKATMAKSSPVEKSELNKIIGESYFNLKKYDLAIPFLKEYRGKKGKWNNTDYYQLGYAYYKQNDYENAIAQFNKIIGGKDVVAQNAYYHLGESYVKTNKKPQALNAFKNASEMDFEPKIQQDAHLNYARLSYDIGNSYQSVPDVLTAYIAKYPSSANKTEIENLLVDSYITSKNYQAALTLFDNNKSIGNKDTHQKVLFYRGLELFSDGNYPNALPLFKKSIGIQVDPVIAARATFWKAEIEYIQENFNEALLSFKQYLGYTQAIKTPEFKNINYNVAYCYFKMKEYEQSGDFFQKYIETSNQDKARLTDACLRLGDCRFVTTKYQAAMEAYNKAIDLKAIDADYAAYQKAMSYGFMNKNDKKITDFNQFLKNFPKSSYRDDALFELANTYTASNQTAQALKTYDQLIAEFQSGIYTSKAILRQGLIYYNADKDELALTKFKKVVADFPKSDEAIEAVKTARLIYVNNGKVDEYATWVKSLNFVEVSDSDLDNDSFESGEKQYLQDNTKQAIANLSSYINTFPNGIHILKAHFFLAQSYYKSGLVDKSIPHYEYVIAKSKSDYTEQSLSRLSETYIKKNDYTNAIPVLIRLELESDYPQNKTYAQANLMKGYYDGKDYSNAVIYAQKVLDNPKTDVKIKSDAQIIIARAAIKVNDEVKAREAYTKLQKIAKGELAAEALYYEAYFKNKDSKYEDSNKIVQKLAKDYSAYKYFGAKGLIVMAKNYYGLKDSFQATYILESVIKNFKDYADVTDEAQKQLDIIKTEESKTNSSVTK